MPFVIRVRKEFQSAHFLTYYKGKPEPLHGHTWELEVFIKADTLDKGGIGFDFLEIQEFLDEITPDYVCLNDIFDFSPSAENLAKWFYEKIKERYPTVQKVVVWETKYGGAEYYE
ncbi:6-pyruvoyl trahydropterin synthase family protein [Persephonella sp.]